MSTVITTAAGPRSSCCVKEIHVARTVSDLVLYDAVALELDPLSPETVMPTLVVRYNGSNYPYGTNDYTARCKGCDTELEVEVEERE